MEDVPELFVAVGSGMDHGIKALIALITLLDIAVSYKL